MESDWNWTAEKDLTVFPTARAVAVYSNPAGDIVIRQEGIDGEDDAVIIIPRAYAPSVMNAVNRELEQEVTPEEG